MLTLSLKITYRIAGGHIQSLEYAPDEIRLSDDQESVIIVSGDSKDYFELEKIVALDLKVEK